MLELKSCPFCGHVIYDIQDALHPTGRGWRVDDDIRHYLPAKESHRFHGEVWSLNCLENEGGCGVEMNGDSREEVIEKWQRRV